MSTTYTTKRNAPARIFYPEHTKPMTTGDNYCCRDECMPDERQPGIRLNITSK
jgi:hypothetical protein